MWRSLRAFAICGAILVLACSASAADTATLLSDLKAKDAATRQKACEGLAGVKATDEVVTALCDATCDKSPKVAAAALSALEQVRPDIHKHLSTMHLDKSQLARADAADALGKLGGKASPAVRAMVAIAAKDTAQLANGRDGSRGAILSTVKAVKAIGITDEEAAKAVGGIVASSDNPSVRITALEALTAWSKGEKNTDILFAAVKPLFAGKETLQVAACKAVAEFGDQAKKEFGKTVDALKLSSDKKVREAATAAADKWAK